MEGNKIEIGQQVTWKCGRDNCFTLKGLYLQTKNEEFSEVLCLFRDNIQCCTKMEVLTKIIEVI